ncbi:MAG TPA: C-GCAxxG-C-C family protein [Candidatus Dorea intestinavium]|nr:C-GCAxxG-C-C family protein [Candidatus Dorea intestinavium]
MTKNDINTAFAEGTDCSQLVLEAFADKLAMDKDLAHRISAAFGAGMHQGETCGAVTGAGMVLGLKYGNDKELLLTKTEEFRNQIAKKYNSCMCKGILGYDISKEEERAKILEENLLFITCPAVVLDSIEILEKLL